MNVSLSAVAKKQLKKLDTPIRKRIVNFLSEVEKLDDPRSRGKSLVGNFSGFWRYRVGDYRLICRIQDAELMILVVEIGHRRKVYENK